MVKIFKYLALLLLWIVVVIDANSDNEHVQDVVVGVDGTIEPPIRSKDEVNNGEVLQSDHSTEEESKNDVHVSHDAEESQQVTEEKSETRQIDRVENIENTIVVSEQHEPAKQEVRETEREMHVEESATINTDSVSDTSTDEDISITSDAGLKSPDEVVDPNCPNRSHIIKCASKYLDTDTDGRLSRVELDTAIGRLPWYVNYRQFFFLYSLS
jgi:hypothetical protein